MLHSTALSSAWAPPLSGRQGVAPNSDRVPRHPQVALFWVLSGQRCPSSSRAVLWGRKPGPRESLRFVRAHNGRVCDFPGTLAELWEPGLASHPLRPPASKPSQVGGNRSPPQGSERGRSDWGTGQSDPGMGRSDPEMGRGEMVAGGAGRPVAPDSVAPARLRTHWDPRSRRAPAR